MQVEGPGRLSGCRAIRIILTVLLAYPGGACQKKSPTIPIFHTRPHTEK